MKEVKKKKILIVEDDASLGRELAILLRGAGYEPIVLDDFSDTRQSILDAGADLILLDINLPGLNGEEILRSLRKELKTPVIMVTSRTSEADEVLSMSYGADDYVTKPYNTTILLLRIAAVFRRMDGQEEDLHYNGLAVFPSKGMLSDGDRELDLTKNEMIIFEVLLKKQGNIVSRDELMTVLWDNDEYVNDNALSVNISRLRSKLADFGYPDAIETKKKRGYLLK